jgi:membrane AbrB-like protein
MITQTQDSMRKTIMKFSAAVVVGAAMGYIVNLGGVPAGWLLGALFGTGLLRSLIGPLRFTNTLRRIGQLIVGASVAGLLTPSVIGTLGSLLVWLVLFAIAVNAFCFVLSYPTARLARMDRRTAALCCLPGGLSEMGSLARDVGADEQAVTIFHTIRVTLIVTAVPILLTLLGLHASSIVVSPDVPSYDQVWILLFLILVSAPLAKFASRLGIVNPWVVMPILIGIVIVFAGLQTGTMPYPFIVAAQIAIGIALGARFDIRRLVALPRIFVVGLLISVVLVLTTLLVGGAVLAPLIGVSIGTGVVSMAPGGLAEMIAVSRAMDLLPTTVAAFGIVRSVLTNTVMAQLVSRIPITVDREPSD